MQQQNFNSAKFLQYMIFPGPSVLGKVMVPVWAMSVAVCMV